MTGHFFYRLAAAPPRAPKDELSSKFRMSALDETEKLYFSSVTNDFRSDVGSLTPGTMRPG